MPDLNYLRKRLSEDLVVQDAYLAMGDFDLVIYAVGLTLTGYMSWQFRLKQDLSQYEPSVKTITPGDFSAGFFPLRNGLIKRAKPFRTLRKKY